MIAEVCGSEGAGASDCAANSVGASILNKSLASEVHGQSGPHLKSSWALCDAIGGPAWLPNPHVARVSRTAKILYNAA